MKQLATNVQASKHTQIFLLHADHKAQMYIW